MDRELGVEPNPHEVEACSECDNRATTTKNFFCDCHRGNGANYKKWQLENRYYKHPKLDLYVTYFIWNPDPKTLRGHASTDYATILAETAHGG